MSYIGQRINKLEVIDELKFENITLLKVKCKCGRETLASEEAFNSGHLKSCGCKRENIDGQILGSKRLRLNRIWSKMKDRCNNPNSRSYPHYGGRGITVCKEWNLFSNFALWALNNGYRDDLSIDRIDVNGNYCPENCRWADVFTQANNKTDNVYLELDGERMSAQQWARKLNVSVRTLYNRVAKGMSDKEVLDRKSFGRRYVTYNGVEDSIVGWAKKFGIDRGIMYSRLMLHNFDIEEVMAHFPDMKLDNIEVTN